MNVCFVNTLDQMGGAERCSYDLYRGLRECGHQTSLVVGKKLSGDPDVHACRYPAWDWKPRAFLHYRLGLTDTTLATPFRMIYRSPAFTNADVVNIHNMHGGYWNFWTVPALARRKPVILTLHDEWLFTGDCVYAYGCDRWRNSCGSCPQMLSDFRPDLGGRDFTRGNLWLKRAALRVSRTAGVRIVTPSQWLAARARQTSLGRFPISVIPNGIDLSLFRPRERASAKARFELPQDKFCFLFLAGNVQDPRKGVGKLEDALARFGLPPNSVLLVAGSGASALATRFPGLEIRTAGFLEEKDLVAECLSAADCMLLLSQADNLPYTAIEAGACGLPVLAYDVGGIPEIVEDGHNGKLLPLGAPPEQLAAAMREFSGLDAAEWRRLSSQARERAMKRFSLPQFLSSYESLMSQLL